MTRRIVVYGATGYQGRLVATALARAKVRPVLAGRNLQSLHALGVQLGHGLDTIAADVNDTESLLRLIQPGDVVVSTVGPYAKLGLPVAEACIVQRATYLDCCGEPGFLRVLFHGLGPFAANRGLALIPGFGYEYVAGSVAASLVLEATGQRADRIDVGYFVTGKLRALMSTGTRASVGAAALTPHYAWRDRQLVECTAGDRVIGFAVDGHVLPGLSIGGAEHITIPRSRPWIREVGVYVGGPKSAAVARVAGAVVAGAGKVPGVPELVRWTAALPRVSDGPDDETRARSGSAVVATAYDHAGRQLATTRMAGGDPYAFTETMLAWAAMRIAANGQVLKAGVLGPVEAFGLETLVDACAGAGLRVLPE
jgi:short subunit dehydrogenase-like uncharacterized protein